MQVNKKVKKSKYSSIYKKTSRRVFVVININDKKISGFPDKYIIITNTENKAPTVDKKI